MLCALRVLGGSKFTQIHKVDCHLPPCRAAVAGVEGGYIYVFSFIIYFNCCRQLTYKHPIRTPDRWKLMHLRGTTKAPASPHTTRAGGAEIGDGHPGSVKARGGGGRDEEWKGAEFHYLVHHKGFYCNGFASLAFFVA